MRILLTAVVAVLVTAVLFLLMQALIKDRVTVVADPPATPPIDIVDVPVEKPPEETSDDPPPVKPPPGVPTESVLVKTPDHEIDFDDPVPGQPTGGDAFKVSLSEGGDPIPVITIAPQYPRSELLNGTEGWVRVTFTIRPDGSVADAAVVDAHPRRGVFDHAALNALRNWQFRPRRGEDGSPVASRAEYTIEFKLDGGA